ncbi:asparagine synthase (glutamine-hydrolysing) [Acetitomaculum ruminis DSM 5522]|uniref:asparagine synthase (glutamine-hydrolyzing) n=1 Tax=Acetitomaculum ruminis DSM 5522 TaxID=1120918 RepID=A0A1I0V0T2_9FIRM|nr:asparagine synthase (glutamine-hydrolyzing) [Acetitomaculum ruminis]SFA69647.1 asparagine synthase (glutamine-hydrolysing) [Acetitomaculum ruminis DSM 5522]
MCGISGFVGKCDEPQKVLENMMNKIIHRGPDSEGMYLSSPAALGFRRLSIIDLNNGTQPMKNEDGSLIVTFNGEIYNYQVLREDLIKKGHVFSNHSDTEVLLHGYEEYGKELVKKLRGMFAFVIWDEKTKTLFGARDYFGIKPFYYANTNGSFIYSSEIKSILAHPAYEKEFNPDALEAYLSFQYSVLPETFFKGIFKLPPAHCFTLKDGKLDIERFWEPVFEEDEKKSVEEAIEDIDKVMADSVKHHMIADVEVGSLLSSGVDSSFVVSRFNGAKTFSVGFENDNYNEVAYAERFTNKMGIENDRHIIDSKEYFSVLDDVAYYMDEPLADASCVALYIVDSMAAKKVKVVLSGEGADEFFGGYNIYHEPVSLRPFKVLPKGLKKGIKKWAERSNINFKGKNYIIRGCTPLEKRFIGNAKRFSRKEANQILKNGVKKENNFPFSITEPLYKRAKGSDFAKMQYIDINLWLIGDILLKADKMSMAHSLESRVPFLDVEVFNVARKLPSYCKIHNKVTKYAFRQVAEKYIPSEVAEKKKLGFPIPIARWLREDNYYNMVKGYFESDYAAKFFKQEEIMRFLDNHKKGIKDESKKIWTIFMFLKWYDIYFNNNYVEKGGK